METKEMVDILLQYADRGVPLEKYKIANAIANRLRYLQNEVDKEKWVSVDERLPDKEGIYHAVMRRDGRVISVHFAPTNSNIESWNSRYTHWKPFPEPPKEA